MPHHNDSFSNQPNRERGKPKGCYTLSRELLIALDAHHARTGESKSSIVEAAVRARLGIAEASGEKSSAPTKIV